MGFRKDINGNKNSADFTATSRCCSPFLLFDDCSSSSWLKRAVRMLMESEDSCVEFEIMIDSNVQPLHVNWCTRKSHRKPIQWDTSNSTLHGFPQAQFRLDAVCACCFIDIFPVQIVIRLNDGERRIRFEIWLEKDNPASH
jgi:hypothetical protein